MFICLSQAQVENMSKDIAVSQQEYLLNYYTYINKHIVYTWQCAHIVALHVTIHIRIYKDQNIFYINMHLISGKTGLHLFIDTPF